jgi:putative DNA primase/helicase
MTGDTRDYERARSALAFIPADDRDLWVRMGMALKSELGDAGFDLWDSWSRQSNRYNERDARDVWRSCKANGGVTAGTLFHEAKARGWRDEGTPREPTAEELEARRRQAAERSAKEEFEQARERAQAAKWARALCAIATSAREPHPYLIRKGLAGVEGLREVHASQMQEILGYQPKSRKGETLAGRLLVVPVKKGDELTTVELIDSAGHKAFLRGRGTASGGFWPAQGLPDGDGTGLTILVGEGIATVVSAREASGHLVIAALASGNLPAAAKAMRKRYPAATLGLLADLGKGQKDAEEAARATGSALVLPEFGPDRPEGATDFNDLHAHRGLEAVAECIAQQLAAHAAQEKARQEDAKAEPETKAEPGLTDLGNAHRFTREHQRDVRYCWPWQKWLVWNGLFWARDETGEVHRLAEKTVRGMYLEAAQSSPDRREVLATWAVKCESHERRAKMLASGQAIAGIPVRPVDLDRDPMLLNVRNGTLDLRTGALRPHAREDLITRGLEVDYDPAAVCPTWERFLSDVFDGVAETIAFMQRAIGYSLTGATTEHVLIVLYGLGSNGKTTLIGALHDLLVSYAQHAPTDLLLARRGEHHPTELATLHGARLVTAAETGEGRRLAESLVKQLTGGDPVTVRRMREDFWQYRPEFKLWVCTNHKPQIRGTDHAIWRRIHLVPFRVTFHEPETRKTPMKDLTLPGRLRQELAGILRWAVEGCLAWQREGLKAPKTVREATEEYRVEMDVLAAFLDECCIFDQRAQARASELYEAYKRWCDRSSEHAETQTSFGTRLGELGLAKRPIGGRTVYQGIGLSAGEGRDSGDPIYGLLRAKEKHSYKPRNGSQPSQPSRSCPRCDGEGCDWCGGMGRLVDDQPEEPAA